MSETSATVSDLLAVERLIHGLSEKDKAALSKLPGIKEELKRGWLPNPGPQTAAYYCEADETLYGGEAGGGKTDLLVGLAKNEHQRSRILRRINEDVREVADRYVEIFGDDGFKLNPPIWKDGDRFIEFRGCELEKDKQRFKGKARDFIGYDELADFLESQYVFINTWNRSTDPDQRCRIVGATNGPTTAEGQWIVRRWGAWLDPSHHNPAKDGELRWYLTKDGKDIEVDGPGPHEIRGRMVRATSRTFIRSRLEDNPDLDETGYGDRLEGLPEDLRRVYREGEMGLTFRDAEDQVIPTAWIRAAQDRWKPDGWKEFQMTVQALDCFGGGRDDAALASRHGGWYAPIQTLKSAQIPENEEPSSAMFLMVVKSRKANAPLVVDSGGGYASGVILLSRENGIPYRKFDGASGSIRTARETGLKFANKRAEAIWKFREELDPNQEGGSPIALPPDPEVTADLAAPRFTVTTRGIVIESKDDIRKRLGRSTNKGDAVVMCLSEGNAAVQRQLGGGIGKKLNVQLGYANVKRRK